MLIVGRGKAGGSLAASLRQAGVDVVVVKGRASAQRRRTKLDATLVLLCVPDRFLGDVIVDVDEDAIVCHVAGALGLAALSALPEKRRGVFHPLASLDGRHVVPRGCLCAYDGSDDDVRARLVRLAKRIGLVPRRVEDQQRAGYHAGAVIAGNLATALLQLGVEQLLRAGVDEATARVSLARLLASTAERAVARPLPEALTGPVARRDAATLRAHLGAIDDDDARAAYRLLSRVLIERVLPRDTGPDGDGDSAGDGPNDDVRTALLNALR